MQVTVSEGGTQVGSTQVPQQHAELSRIARWPWLFAALIAVTNAVTAPPLFSGNAGLLVSILLAIAALAGLPLLTEGIKTKRTAAIGGRVVIILFIAAQILCRFNVGRIQEAPGLDFSAYYLAGKALSEPTKPLYYVPKHPDGRMIFIPSSDQNYWHRMAMRESIPKTMQFNYPPFAAVLARPFALLSFPIALKLWTGLTVALLLGSIYLIILIGEAQNRVCVLVAAAIGVFSAAPVTNTFELGQINAVLLFLWTLGVYLYKKNRPSSCALCFALGSMIKITPVMVVPLFILTRKWRWLAWFAGWAGLLFVIGVAGTGWRNLQTYVSEVLPSMSCGTPYFANRSVGALVQYWHLKWVPSMHELPATMPPSICTAAKIAGALVYLAMLVTLYRAIRRRDLTEALMMMALVTLLVSPVTWMHHYVLAILPLLYIWLAKLHDASREFFWAIVLATMLIGSDVALTILKIVRHGGLDLALAALPPISLVLLIVLFALGHQRTKVLSAAEV